MFYQVLARKWRPKKFIDIIGQEHILATLINTLRLKKIHHAYLLSGMHGIGKTTLARLLAKCLNCETGITVEPCGACENCQKIEKNCFVDLIEIDAASRTKVENIKELLDNIRYLPIYGRFKIYLIDEVHMLSRYSFNALLKTLEEPPTHVKFILATTDLQRLPLTVLSRCFQLHLKALNISQIINKLEYILKKEKINIDYNALKKISNASHGSMRDALSLTEQAIVLGNNNVTDENVTAMLGLINYEQALLLIESLANLDYHAVMKCIKKCADDNLNWEDLIINMLSIIHTLTIGQILPDKFNNNQKDITSRLYKLSKFIPTANLHLYYQAILIGRKELPYAPTRRMGVEMILLRILTLHSGKHSSCINITNQVNQDVSNTSVNLINNFPSIKYDDKKSSEDKQSIVKINELNSNYNLDLKKKINKIDLKFIEKKSQKEILKYKSSTETSFLSNELLNSNLNELLKARINLLKNYNDQKIKKDKLSCQKEDTKNELQNSIKLSCSKDAYDNHCNILHNKNKLVLVDRIIQESMKYDLWTSQIYRLSISESARDLALNTWKEDFLSKKKICLHLKRNQSYLNSKIARISLCKALSLDTGIDIELIIQEDDNEGMQTPLELYYKIYKEKLLIAKKNLDCDSNIKMLKKFFDVKLDINNIELI